MLMREVFSNSYTKTVFWRTLKRSLYAALSLRESYSQKPAAFPCLRCRYLSTSTKKEKYIKQPSEWSSKFRSTNPEFDWDYLCNSKNLSLIQDNIKIRKGVGDIQKVLYLYDKYHKEVDETHKDVLWKELIVATANLPNTHHSSTPLGEESNARLVETVGKLREFDFEPKTVVELGENLDILRTENVSTATGPRTYYFKDELADLEYALIQFTLDNLKREGFELVSVPDLIYAPVIESCGFKTSGERNQVYKLSDEFEGVCLAGTAEMSLAGYVTDECLKQSDLPKKLTAVSRCYRREASDVQEERGIYRVHQFTKIEMFGVTENKTGEESDQLLQQFLKIEKSLYTQLGLHFRILEMPTQCLGAPAHRKFDMETWMPAKQFWGEISSASNCTDYQSRRLGIKYKDGGNSERHAHTINGTACAVPRMIMAIMENYQRKDGSVDIPEVLQPYMGNKTQLLPLDCPPSLQWIKVRKLKANKS